jgi:ribosomal-protein-alanine N-acetyltransferase
MLCPDFSPFPVLETERVLLRRMTAADAGEIFFLRSNESVIRFIAREPAAHIGEAQDFIRKIDAAIDVNESVLWGIALKEFPAKLIGTICIWNLQKENFRAELGFVLDPQHWRKGYMKESILKVISYGFSTLQLHRVEARVLAGNTASSAILEATGFVKEGCLRDDCFFRGQFLDTLIYSRLQ